MNDTHLKTDLVKKYPWYNKKNCHVCRYSAVSHLVYNTQMILNINISYAKKFKLNCMYNASFRFIKEKFEL